MGVTVAEDQLTNVHFYQQIFAIRFQPFYKDLIEVVVSLPEGKQLTITKVSISMSNKLVFPLKAGFQVICPSL